MSSNRQSTKALAPEEQVNFHPAIQGKDGIELDGQYEQKKSGYSLLDGNFRRFLDHGREGVPIAKMSTDLFTKNDFFFDEADKPYRGWKLDRVSFTDESCTPETIILEFARLCADREERITKPLADLSDENFIQVDDLVYAVDRHLADIQSIAEETDGDGDDDVDADDRQDGYDDYITDIDEDPVFGALEYALATHQIIGSKISEAYDEILPLVEAAGINNGDDDITAVIPIDIVFDILSDKDRTNPEIYELMAVTRLRESGNIAILGHKYAERNSRRRRKELVFPLDVLSVGAVIGILERLERYFDEEELDDDE